MQNSEIENISLSLWVSTNYLNTLKHLRGKCNPPTFANPACVLLPETCNIKPWHSTNFIRIKTKSYNVNFVNLNFLTSINSCYLMTNLQSSVTMEDKWSNHFRSAYTCELFILKVNMVNKPYWHRLDDDRLDSVFMLQLLKYFQVLIF